MDKLCILICTHNRLGLLKRTLGYIQRAELPAIDVKICVVANACDDGTQAYLAEYAVLSPTLALPVEWIDVPVAGKSHALNVVIPQLAGWALAMVDDGCGGHCSCGLWIGHQEGRLGRRRMRCWRAL
mgnify:CR=1 FL=1